MKEIELINKRKKYEKYFLKSNGTNVVKVYDEPVHFESNGKLIDINNKLEKKGSTTENQKNSFKIVFDNYLYNLYEDDMYFQVQLMNENNHNFSILKDNCKNYGKGRYIDILKNIDIEYIVHSNKIKENIYLKNNEFEVDEISFKIETNYDLEIIDNVIYLKKGEEKKYKFNKIFAVDSNFNYLDNISVNLIKNNNNYILKIFLDNDWFKDKDRKYPIIIDPTITSIDNNNSVIDTYIKQTRPNTNFSSSDQLLVGNWTTDDNTDDIHRTLLKFNLPTIGTGCQIVNARVRLVGYPYIYGIHAFRYLETHRITQDWSEELATWDSMHNKFDSKIESIFYSMSSETNGSDDEIEYIENHFDITNLVKKWYSDVPNYGIMIKDIDETKQVDFLSKFFSKENLVSGDNPKPVLEITYINQNGLESYMNYFKKELTNGGLYFNLSNGNTTFTLDLITSKDKKYPSLLSLVYNTNDVALNNNYNGIGNGFKFNYNQQIFEDNTNDPILCYLDKDSTIHYLSNYKEVIDENGEVVTESEPDVFYDDEGLGYIINKYDTYYLLSDINKNTLKFTIINNIGYLTEIDTCLGNKTYIYYDNNQRISKIVDDSNDEINITYSENQIIINSSRGQNTLNISNNLISSITNVNGSYLLTYDSNNLLSSVKDYNLRKVLMEYYDNSPYKIKKIYEYGTDEINYKLYEFSYGFDSTSIKDYLGRVNTFCYNYRGNIISTTVKQIENNLAVNYGFTRNYGESGQFINKVISSSSLMKPVENLIKNSSYEDDLLKTYPDVSLTNENINASISNDYANTGNKSLKINSSAANLEYRERFPIYNEQGNYTFSAFIKNNCKIKMFAEFYDLNSNLVKIESEIIDINLDFSRYDISFNCENAQNYITIGYIFLESGVAYIDDIQLEKGNVCNDYNLLEKMLISNDFATEWNIEAGSLLNDDAIVNPSDFISQEVIDGMNAIKVEMHPDLSTSFGKTLNISGHAGDKYTICFWYKNHGLNNDDPDAYNNVMVSFDYDLGDEYVDGHCILPGERLVPNEDEWQFYMESFVAEYDYTSLEVLFFQSFDANDLYISNISLFKGCKSTYFEYNEEGQIDGSVTPLGKESSVIYNDYNLLTVIKDSNINKLCYEYNTDNKIFKCLTPMKLNTEILYDNGNRNIGTKVRNIDNNVSIFDKYYIRCPKTNDYLKIKCNDVYISNNKYLLDYWIFEPIIIDNKTYYKIYHSIIENKYFSCFLGKLVLKNYDSDYCLFELLKNENGSYSIKSKTFDIYLSLSAQNELVFLNYINDSAISEFYIEKFTNKYFSERNKKYNEDGILIQTTDELLNNTIVEVNEQELPTKTTFGNNYSLITYDSNNKISKYNKNGGELNYLYNEYKLLSQISYNNKHYRLFYDNYLNLYRVYLDEQLLLENVRDNYGDRITNTNYINGNIYYSYDTFGRVITKTKSNDTYNYYYDNSGNMVKMTKGDYYCKINYDIENKIYGIKTSDFNIDYSFDSLSNLIKKIFSFGNTKYIVLADYDNDNNLIKTTFDNVEFSNELDSLQRILNTKINNITISSKEYYGNGYRQSTLVKKYTVLGDTYTFIFDKNYNIRIILKNNYKIYKYKYDNYNQLVQELDYENKIRTKYNYDLNGNIKSIIKYDLETFNFISKDDYSYNEKDLLSNYNNIVLEYDQLGNVISLGDDNLEWSNGKELKKYYNSDNIYNYYYNDNGIRTKKIINGFSTDYYLEDSNIFLEKNDNYTLFFIREFDNSLVGFKYNNNLYYYVKDAFDSIIGILDTSNNIVAKYKYDTWGNILSILDGNDNDVSNNMSHIANINPFRYRGYYYDKETEMYYLGYRYYNPRIRRFISTDNAIYDDVIGGNLYVYCYNNPVSKKDEDGRFGLFAIALTCGIINAGSKYILSKIEGEDYTFQDGLYYFATGAVGGLVGTIDPLLGIATTTIADDVRDTVKKRKKENKRKKDKGIKESRGEKIENILNDISDITMDVSIDIITGHYIGKIVDSAIPRKGGANPTKFLKKFTGKKAQNLYKRSGYEGILTTTVDFFQDFLGDGYNNFEEPKEVVNINAPMCGLHDDRHYLRNAEE